uniref:Ig-like domain-containing protein n=1 Tax=Sphaeramia orbicularis TaxID=375764 RepID=A0A672YL55_9TELE
YKILFSSDIRTLICEAFLNCHLMKSEDVVQYFSPRVNPEFRDKVEFKDAGLQNSTIIIKNVNQQDEGCYNCVFSIQHQGAITCKTCLQIYAVIPELTIAVKVGGEAFLNCYLMKSEDVVQVTWQKISPEMNLATNSKYFSPRVNPEFRHKVEFKDAGLQNSTIIIKNVKQQDEGCYNCLFNIQHQGAITCKTCLQIYGKNLLASLNVCFFSSIPVEIPALEPTHVCSCVFLAELNEPVLHVSKSSSTAEFIVSCSATGRPAPTVTLSVQGQNFSHTSTVRVPNTNGTVTVNTTAVLSGLHRTSTRVRCSVRLAFGSETEVFTTIPGKKCFQRHTLIVW